MWQSCGSGSGIRCFYDLSIRDSWKGFSNSRISDPRSQKQVRQQFFYPSFIVVVGVQDPGSRIQDLRSRIQDLRSWMENIWIRDEKSRIRNTGPVPGTGMYGTWELKRSLHPSTMQVKANLPPCRGTCFSSQHRDEDFLSYTCTTANISYPFQKRYG